MKMFSKITAILFASLLLFNSASAAEVSASQPYTKLTKPAAWQVAIINNTNEDYMVYAGFLPEHLLWDTYLGPYGYPTDEIYYSFGVPLYCFTIIRTLDHDISYSGCKSSGTIYLYPPVSKTAEVKNAKTLAAPVIKTTDK
jgi:hypothetical protein